MADDRRIEIERVLNGILDPCAVAANTSLGLVDMGIVELVAVTGNSVRLSLLPTFPGCLFVGVFEDEIRRLLKELTWCRKVEVTLAPAEMEWDESRMTHAGRARLNGLRSRRQSALELS